MAGNLSAFPAGVPPAPARLRLSVVQGSTIDELNYLGKLLEMQGDDDRDKFTAAVTLGEHAGRKMFRSFVFSFLLRQRYGNCPFYCFPVCCAATFFEERKVAFTPKIAAALLKSGKANVKGLYSPKTGKTYDGTVVLADTGGKYVNYRIEVKKN